MTITIHFPQVIYTGLILLGVAINIAKHGENRPYDGWSAVTGLVISLLILWWGGFYG